MRRDLLQVSRGCRQVKGAFRGPRGNFLPWLWAQAFDFSVVFCSIARASSAVAGRGGRPRTEWSEGGGSRSPAGDLPDHRGGENSGGRKPCPARTNPSGVQAAAGPWRAGVQGAVTKRPLPARSGRLNEREKQAFGSRTEDDRREPFVEIFLLLGFLSPSLQKGKPRRNRGFPF